MTAPNNPLAGVEAWAVDPHTGTMTPCPSGDTSVAGNLARWLHFTEPDAFDQWSAHSGEQIGATVTALLEASARHRVTAHVSRFPDNWLLFVTPTLSCSQHQMHSGLVICLVTDQLVATLETGDAGIWDEATHRFRTSGLRRGSAVQQVVTAMMLALLASAGSVEAHLGESVAQLERVVFGDPESDPTQRIYALKRDVVTARRALLPMSSELPDLVDPTADRRTAVVERRQLDRLVSSFERIDAHLDADDGLLSDMLQVHLARISVRQNEDMRKISAWGAILVFPTIVAGVYGMNFARMPELHWVAGYPLSIALMGIGCFIFYRVLRRAGWL